MTATRTKLLAIGLCCAAGVASAHSLNLFVHDEGAVIRGKAYFSGGTPAQGLTVRAEDTTGKLIGEASTDAEGNFVYTGPRAAGTTVFVVSTADGHRAVAGIASVEGAGEPANVPATSSNTGMISYEAQITSLHEAIDRLEKRLWLRDVIGGIGYIFGLAGLWALWKARGASRGH